LRQEAELSLRRLGVETIDLFQLHRIDDKFPLADQIGELVKLQEEGKIRHIGLCNVDVALLAKARSVATVVSVQIPYNYLSRESDQLLSICERDHMAFLPARPLGTGQLVNSTDSRLAGLQAIAKERNISQPQAVLAWLLARSPVMLVIPGTRQVEHLEDNIAAAKVRFTKQEMERIG
jgi:pyridoxine 4-dehydrogenase